MKPFVRLAVVSPKSQTAEAKRAPQVPDTKKGKQNPHHYTCRTVRLHRGGRLASQRMGRDVPEPRALYEELSSAEFGERKRKQKERDRDRDENKKGGER